MVQWSSASSTTSSSSSSNMKSTKAKSDSSSATKQHQQKGAGALTKIVRESKGAGSRRIFSPVFKLQVLDSYRQDADCQGNQRATARKYGIHRRQIQKWLQMETNLRLSVQQQQSNVVTSSTMTKSAATVAALNLSPTRQSDASANTFVACDTKSSYGLGFAVQCPEDDMSDPLAGSPVCDNSPSDVEEYVNVDEISDTEEEEVGEYEEEDFETSSSCSSNEKALDFTCATLSKQRFFSDDFKRQVLDAFQNDKTCRGNHRATAGKFGIPRFLVQKWVNTEQQQQQQIVVQSSEPCCLDLSCSYKRKLDEDPYASKRCRGSDGGSDVADDAQESALCLVKDEKLQSFENKYHQFHHIVYPSHMDHSYNGGSYLGHDYPLCAYPPWSYCCEPRYIPGAHVDCLSKYSYSLNFKYETSYVDIPVQYGFGDSVPSKWINELSSYR